MHLSGDQDADMAAIAAAFEGRQALHPRDAAPVKLAPPHAGPERRQG
ncbi:hypothetical protein ACFPOU_03205 [Massilia jejuensis]|uniref:Uncharacterized protein n=1 Tax=Massilia jejuensis TaxID=648894 RepID=A0ABW0PCH2_9BURK